MKTKEYNVTLPLVGHVYLSFEAPVDASDEYLFEAAEEAWSKRLADRSDPGFDSLEAVEHVCEGNVCYAEYPDFKVDGD